MASVPVRGEQDCVAVGCALRDLPRADRSGGAAAIVHHDLLAERITPNLSAMLRTTMVALPPGGNGTTSVIGRLG